MTWVCSRAAGKITSGKPHVLPLFSADVDVPPAGLDVSFTFSQAEAAYPAHLGIMLRLESDNGSQESFLLGESLEPPCLQGVTDRRALINVVHPATAYCSG